MLRFQGTWGRPIVATALLLDRPLWTEDREFSGSGVAAWTTQNVGLYLKG